MSETQKTFCHSDSFPLNEKGERQNIPPLSEYHNLIKNIKNIDRSKIEYHPLIKEDLEEIKKLHKEWFPVRYDDKWFDAIFLNEGGRYFHVGAFYKVETEKNKFKDIILGLAIGEWRYIDDYFAYMCGNKITNTISDNIDITAELKAYYTCDKYHCVYILTIGVLDECRKFHIGTCMLNCIFNYVLYDDLCLCAYLNVITCNESGKKFYEKNGFVITKKHEKFYEIDKKLYDSEALVRVFTKKERAFYRNRITPPFMKWVNLLVMTPICIIFKIFLYLFLFQCCRKKIRIKEKYD